MVFRGMPAICQVQLLDRTTARCESNASLHHGFLIRIHQIQLPEVVTSCFNRSGWTTLKQRKWIALLGLAPKAGEEVPPHVSQRRILTNSTNLCRSLRLLTRTPAVPWPSQTEWTKSKRIYWNLMNIYYLRMFALFDWSTYNQWIK